MTNNEKTRRTVNTSTTTRVRHFAEPWGKDRENGPHLGDLRTFVAACEGLPDDLMVYIRDGHLDEGGRRTVTIETAQTIAVEESP